MSKSYIEFVADSVYGWDFRKGLPCPCCRGRGWLYDPNDPPCPIEGNKMRDRIKCQKCVGNGRGEFDSEWKKAYNKYKAHEKRKQKEKVDNRKRLEIIKKKLTVKQFQWIQQHGFHYVET